jgi:hypothetical protein
MREVADRCETGLARDACEEAARDAVAILRIVTPKRTGALADSEIVNFVEGGGEHATANYGPHKIYDHFRNYGGTITKHSPGSLGTPEAGWFGHSVTQRGSHYMERGEAAAKPAVAAACAAVLERYLTL